MYLVYLLCLLVFIIWAHWRTLGLDRAAARLRRGPSRKPDAVETARRMAAEAGRRAPSRQALPDAPDRGRAEAPERPETRFRTPRSRRPGRGTDAG